MVLYCLWRNFGRKRLVTCLTNRQVHGESATYLLQRLTNYETKGVPRNAGVDTDEGFDLGRMHHLLQLLGDPHRQLQVVHVAGTKGKGSVSVMLGNIARTAGLTTGLYTSPHVTSVHERIQVTGVPIAAEQLDGLVQRHRHSLERAQEGCGGRLSYFEALTALALRHFADQQVDVGIIETGLGGVRDATNVFDSRSLRCAVITAIGMEHQAALGGTLRSIAAAKAGICKPGVPLVLARQPEAAAEEVVLNMAQEMGCPVHRVVDNAFWQLQGIGQGDQQFSQTGILHLAPTIANALLQAEIASPQPLQLSPSVAPHMPQQPTSATAAVQAVSVAAASAFAPGSNGVAALHMQEGGIPARMNEGWAALPVQLQLLGPHQGANACAAAVAAGVLASQGGLSISHTSVQQGLAHAMLPGRFQVLSCPSQGGQGHPPNLVLDGAHTPASAAVLVETMQQVFPAAPTALVIAMAADKDHQGVLQELRRMLPVVALFSSCDIGGGKLRSAAPGTLLAQWQQVGSRVQGPRRRCREMIMASVTASIQRALMEVAAVADPGVAPVILVTGSLHAVAEAHKVAQQLSAG